MAENEPTTEVAPPDATASAERPLTTRQMVSAARKQVRHSEKSAKKFGSRRFSPARAVGTMAAVCALIAGVAIPAYAASQHETASATASERDEAAGDAQSFAASLDAGSVDLTATTYSARTADEISQMRAEEQALERARADQQRQEEQQAAAPDPGGDGAPAGIPEDAPPPAPEPVGSWVNPLPPGSYYVSRSVSSGHAGTDMVAPAMTPIYAAKGGVVTVSSEAHYGWGVTVAIDHGDGTQTLYGHMTNGTRQVGAGQSVSAGQVIGYVGSTGRSTANHLHIELTVNGAIVDPMAYMPI